LAESDEDVVNVIWGKDRCLRHRDDIGPFVGTLKGMGTMSNGWRMHLGDEGMIKLAALCIVQADGVIIVGIKVDGEGVKSSERCMDYFERRGVGGRSHVINGVASANPSKKPSIWWFAGGSEVIHSLIKSTVLSGFHLFQDNVIVENVAHCLGEAKKDTSASVRKSLVRAVWTSRKSVKLTTENTKETQIWQLASHLFVWRGSVRSMDGNVIEAQEMVECIWPELGKGQHQPA
jgi:hypothetical protein